MIETNLTEEENRENEDSANMKDLSPCFTTSSAIVFTNLHNAAVEESAKLVGYAKGGTINQFIVNSGMTDDGNTISNTTDKINSNVRFSKKDGKFELGIIMNLEPSNGDNPDRAARENRKSVDDAKKRAISALKAYMKTFCDNDNIGEPVQFVPEYKGGKVQVQDGVIVQKKDSDNLIEQFVSSGRKQEELNVKGRDDKEDNEQEEENQEEGILHIGFKIGYTIKYD